MEDRGGALRKAKAPSSIVMSSEFESRGSAMVAHDSASENTIAGERSLAALRTRTPSMPHVGRPPSSSAVRVAGSTRRCGGRVVRKLGGWEVCLLGS